MLLKSLFSNHTRNGCFSGSASVFQWFVVHTLGVHQLWITAENHFGKLTKSVFIVVMQRKLSNLKISTLDSDSRVMAAGTVVDFLIQVEIRTRFNSTMTIDALDGHTHVATLEDTDGQTLALNCTVGEMFVTANYGNGCLLNVRFQHAFENEKAFRPKATVLSGNLSIEAELDSRVTIMNRLMLIEIVSPGFCSVDKVCVFHLQFEPFSDFAEITWSIYKNNDVMETFENLTKLSYMFNESGYFHISVEGRNSISSVADSINVHVFVPLSELHLQCEGGYVFSEAQQILCHAYVMEGTNVQFSWVVHTERRPMASINTNIEGPIKTVNTNLSSDATFMFENVGFYNISVTALNRVSKLSHYLPRLIEIQDEILFVVMKRGWAEYPRGVVMLGDVTLFLVKTFGGSNAHLEFDTGMGRRKYNHLYIKDEDLYEVHFRFSKEGFHDLVVYAYNDVSEVQYSIRVLVQQPVTRLSLTTNQMQPRVTSALVFMVLENGRICRRSDLVYVFTFSDGEKITTGSPAVSKVFTHSGSQYVNVTVSNLVDQILLYYDFTVRDDGEHGILLSNPVFVAVNQPIKFHVQGIDVETFNAEVRFGDGDQPIVVSTIKWEHVYKIPGIYEVSAILHTVSRGNIEVRSVVIAQVPLRELVINAPSFIKIDRITREHLFEAVIIGGGSQVLYSWSLNDHRTPISTVNWIVKEIMDPSTNVLMVGARNDLGDELFAVQEVKVQYPVLKVTLISSPVAEGHLCDITICITGSQNVNIDIDFGDDSSSTLSTGDSDLTVDKTSSSYLPKYNLVIKHKYDVKGQYEVKANVSNDVSWATSDVVVEVGERIGDVTLEILSGHWEQDSVYVMSISSPLTVRATVGRGDNLTFTWDFSEYSEGGTNDHNGNETSSTVTYVFSLADLFQVSVKISSPFYSKPIIFPFKHQFMVVQEIQSVYMKVVSPDKTALPLRRRNGEIQTEEIYFEASCEKGSHISFQFDFGDGTSLVVPGVEVMFPHYIKGTTSHRYTQEGVYNITVIAMNPLGNKTTTLDRPIYVQAASLVGLKLDKSVYYTKLGDVTVMRANYTYGTGVTFDWKLGDQFDILSDSGSVMRHTYQNVGEYRVTVIAKNKVSSQTEQALVVVQSGIQGVRLIASSNTTEVNQIVRLTAKTLPNSGMGTYHNWNFGDNQKGHLSSEPAVDYVYRRTGQFIVTVTAYNNASQAESLPVEIMVMSKVKMLEVRCLNDSLVNRSLEFGAFSYSGSHLTYKWDFGDGSPPLYTTAREPQASHTYVNVGRYFVTLTAFNEISSDTDVIELFVLDRVCKLPKFKVQSQDFTKIFRSDVIYFEAEVARLQCEYTTEIEFQWGMVDQKTNAPVFVQNLDPSLFQRRVLKLPPRSLDVGEYTVSLMVKYTGTVVYATEKLQIEVVPAPLDVHIDGGALVTVGYRGNITLNGTKSNDPNSESLSHLRFNWTCSTSQNNIEEQCFHDNVSLTFNMADPVWTFPVTWLQSGQQYLFILTVSADDLEPQNATQVIEVAERGVKVAIDCPVCQRDIIGENEPIRMEAVCPECIRRLGVSYEWTLSYVKEMTNLVTDKNRKRHPVQCRYGGKSQYELWQLNNTKANSLASDQTSTVIGTTTEEYKTETLTPPVSTTDRTGVIHPVINEGRSSKGRIITTRNGAGAEEKQGMGGVENSFPFISVSEGTENEGRRKTGHPRQEETGPELMSGVKEGFPGEEGSSKGRIPGKIGDGQGVDRIPDLDTNNGKIGESLGGNRKPDLGTNNGDDNVNDQNLEIKPDTIDLMINRGTELILTNIGLATAKNSKSLVIKPYQLTPGRTYVIHLKVQNGQQNGEAKETVFVNSGPSNGACEVAPFSGEEFKTEFKVFCREWQDEHQPIQYQVTFDLGSNHSEVFLYRGLRKSVVFKLPAGLPENKFEVFLKVSVLDGQNAALRYCSTSITVRPARLSGTDGREIGRSDPGSERMTVGNTISELKNQYDSCVKKDNSQTRILTMYLAMLLTRGGHSRYEGLHQELLTNLGDLPMQYEVDILQTAQALVQLTSSPIKMNKACLGVSTSLMQRIVEKSAMISSERQSPIQGLLPLAMEAGSNIVKAISMAARAQTDLWFFREKLAQSIESLEKFVKNEIQYHMIGEPPIRTQEAGFMSALAGVFEFQITPTLNIGKSKIVLPKQLAFPTNKQNTTETVDYGGIPSLGRVSRATTPDCLRTEFLRYETNPYQFVQKGEFMVNSEVTTLNIYDCHGNSIENLQDDDAVSIQLPRRNQSTDQETVYQLTKSNMNVHQFNLTKRSIQQTLHLHIRMAAVTRGRVFPTAILIGYKTHPTPQRYLLKKENPATQNEIRITIPEGYLNASGEYYLGFVDAKYNAGRPRPGEVQSRNYTLHIWHTRCLYWEAEQNYWSRDGCWAADESTYEVTHCRCNHLSTFGSFFGETVPILTLIPVETFFEANENPLCVTILIVALVVYGVLMVACYRKDQHDARKGGILYLRDNALTDQQKYEVIVETGFRRGAGTTAKISVILHGEEGMSGTRELISDDDRPLFERNSRDKFILTLPDSIGKIWKVQIWHNNTGASPSWYLSRVIVKDLNTERMFYFISEKWLAVEEEDGKVEREFLALEGNLGFKRVFLTKGTQYLADYHLWLSPFTCPSYSQFTRNQRLTCCLTLLCVYMCLNTLTYHYTHTTYRGEFGLLDLSWNSVTIGTICCIVAIPLNFLLSFLFRRSKLVPTDSSKTSLTEDKDEDAYPSGKPNATSQEEETDTSAEVVQPIMTYSILDQSILNWPAIQGWAQKQWIKRQQTVIKECQSSQTDTLLNKLIGSETDMASSGFEDSNSTDPRPQVNISSPAISIKNKAPSESSQTTTKSPASTKKNPSSRLLLPTWMQYITWCLCVVIIVCSAVLTVWIGIRFDEVRSILWLQSLYICVMVCVFVVHPTMICLSVLYTAARYRCDPGILDHYEEAYFGETAEREIIRQRKEQSGESVNEAEELEKAVAARQRSRYLRFARPPQEKQLIEARKKVLKEKKALSILIDIISLVVMFLVVCVMAYGKDIQPEYHINRAVSDHFLRGGNQSFESIKCRQDWFNWASTTLVDKIYADNSLKKQKPVLQGNIYIIGHVQLRKVKVTDRACADMDQLPYLSLKCRQNSPSLPRDQDYATFKGKTSPYLLFGRHGIYDNSGYVLKLDHSRNQTRNQILNLTSINWIDDYTKAVFVEFTTFHPPSSLFTSVQLYLEISDTGDAFPGNSISSTYLYKYITRADNFLLFCEMIFILVTVWKLKVVICDVIKLHCLFFQCGWKLLQGILSVVSVTYIGCNVYRFFLVSNILELQRRTYNEDFVDVSFVTFWDELLRCMVGCVLFVVILQSLRLLRFERMFLLFGKIYSRTHKELKLLAVLMLIILLTFASLGHALFGAFFFGFIDFWSSIFTVSAIFYGRYVDLTSEPSLIHATRMFVLFVTMLSLGLSTAYVVAFLSYRFRITKRRQHKVLVLSGPETLMYYWRMLRLWSGLSASDINIEQEVEPDNTLPPEFTMAEIEYQVDELFFRIAALSGSHGLPEKPTNYFTDSDGTYGAGDDGISSGGSEVHDEGRYERAQKIEDNICCLEPWRLEHRVHKIEDNLCREPYLAQLLKIDNIGTENLSKDQENQIRSHLELEIFRQLQIQRQEPADENEKAGQIPDSTDQDQKCGVPINDTTGVNSTLITEVKHLDGKRDIRSRFGESDFKSQENSSSNPDSPESTKNSSTNTKKSIQEDTSPEISQIKTGVKSQISKTVKKPDLPAKPTFLNSGPLRGGLSNDVSKPSLISSPTLRQLKSDKIGIRGEKSGVKGESNSGSSITESSSGSEQDAIHGHIPPIGKRNLRKTKSRGKGKGPVNLSSVLLDEIESELRQREVSGGEDDHFVILEQDVLEDQDIDDNLDA
ncbi:polycystic kidney disease protein 1-like 1 isoform X3 [Ostrea edulis]|uniref:polycystic kidney disease protein 1-like 1 isoform X3 n=1 Tax=Ostrea edulis TaxID=37623 RepID=UPI0024AF97E6|nr:polycystic kidney disease protein 1-like 1 isoform X3 [Ostrea edulis]